MPKEKISEIKIIYVYHYEEFINLFGDEFVKKNDDICKMVIDDKEYEIVSKISSIKIVESIKNNKLEIKLKINN